MLLTLTLPLAHQLGAGDRAAGIRDQRARRAQGDLGRQRVQRSPCRGFDAAMGQFLDAIADPQLQVPRVAFGADLPNMTRHFPCSSGTVMAFRAASSARTSIPSAWRASVVFAPDFLVFFLMRRLQLGFAPVSDDGV